MSLGLELAEAGIEIGEAAGRREACERRMLEVRNLRAGIQKHAVVAAFDAHGNDGDPHEVV